MQCGFIGKFMQTDKKITLALDSTSTPLFMVLESGGKIFTAKKSGIKQEELLYPALNKLFAKAGIKLKDITHFFYIKGPGRFTGIRIGITLASVLSEINGVKSCSADLFEVLKFQAEHSKKYQTWLKKNPRGVLGIVLHAFREEYFSLLCCGGEKPLWCSWQELESKLKNFDNPLFICGWDKDRLALNGKLPQNCTCAPASLNKLNAASLLALNETLQGKQTMTEILEPLYLKPARFELCGK